MLALILNWRSKSFLRSSSGASYPYPRTHTTLMVAPSSRPIGPEGATAVKKQTVRRRPPLNRSIPPIPESKSNESIMSHASRRSSSEKGDNSQQMVCVVIENRNVVDPLQRRQNSVTGIPRLSSTKRSSEQKKQAKVDTTPRSPLMTVAKTVKSKFSKLTRIGRHEQDVSMKGSQSFSGIRQPKSTVPKCIDQNANRVIKSSSMEVASTSQENSESCGGRRMVVIPQNLERLEDFSEETSVAEAVVQKDTNCAVMEEAEDPAKSYEEPKHELSVTLKEDVLVVTRELDPSVQNGEQMTNMVNTDETRQCTRGRTTIFEEHPAKPSLAEDEMRNKSPMGKHYTFTLGEKIPDTSSELKPTEPERSNEKSEEKPLEISGSGKVDIPPRFVMTAKTPESLKKHQTFIVSHTETSVDAIDEELSPKKKKNTKIVKQSSMPESESSFNSQRYVLRMQNAEALARHHTFTISERTTSPDVPFIEESEITEPVATIEPTETNKNKKGEDEKRYKKAEKVDEKSTVDVRTPFILRKLKTGIVEEKLKEKTAARPNSDEACTLTKASIVDRSPITIRTTEAQIMHQSRKQKPMKNEELKCAQRTTLATTVVPPTNNKVKTFETEETKSTGQKETHKLEPYETILDKEISEDVPLKTSEMYVLTMMTPIPQRKEVNQERIIGNKPRSGSASPENGALFVMGGRSQSRRRQSFGMKNSDVIGASRCAVVRPHRDETKFEGKDQSPSDRAEPIERKTSDLSGEMTSPEEEIPMDTHLTPTEELHQEDALIIRSIKHLAEETSAIDQGAAISFVNVHTSNVVVEGSNQSKRADQKKTTETPVFQPPSPPKEPFKPITLSKSTSPLRIKGNSVNVIDESKDDKRKGLRCRSKSVDRKEKSDEKERLKREKCDEKRRSPRSPKVPITARSLRSAGKMFAPSFFRRGDSKIFKASETIQDPSSVMIPTKSHMNLSFRIGRQAPLAEFESSVVENSPAVENNPLTFEKWSGSPRGARRHSAHINVFSEPIVEESDGNGNVCPATPTTPLSSNVHCTMSPTLTRHEPDRGLIDDEIMDQPMLIGDTFSHSESFDCLSAIRRMEFEAEKATLISIDRSLADDDTIPRRTFDNGNAQGSTKTRAATVFAAPPTTYRKALEEGLSEVDDIRSQLEKLQRLVSQEMRDAEVEKLVRENEALRRELHERNELISSLRKQIASQRT